MASQDELPRFGRRRFVAGAGVAQANAHGKALKLTVQLTLRYPVLPLAGSQEFRQRRAGRMGGDMQHTTAVDRLLLTTRKISR